MASLGLCIRYNTVLHKVEEISEAAKESFISDCGSGSDANT